MASDLIKVLVLCTGNSCRSVMAEALIYQLGHGRYHAWSAGSFPAGYVHPKSIETLKRHGIDPGQPRSKSWNEFESHSDRTTAASCCRQKTGPDCPSSTSNQSHVGKKAVSRPRQHMNRSSTAIFELSTKHANAVF